MLNLGKVVFIVLIVLPWTSAEGSYDLQKDGNGKLLLISTLDGSLICLDRELGQIQWRIKEEPVVRVPMKFGKEVPIFLPDPKDGSLYMMASGIEVLQKLPFTIPQLVASSPCRSSDGILYTGKKLDTWFSVNPKTGTKKSLISANGGKDSTCPREGPDSVFIGRTEYNILMMDTLSSENTWNVTFYDYASYEMDHESGQLYGEWLV